MNATQTIHIDRLGNNEYDIDVDYLRKNIEVYYIWGPDDEINLKKAIEMDNYEGDIVNYFDGYWHIYGGIGRRCIFEDFYDAYIPLDEFIHFIDYDKHIMNVRGGQLVNDYERIIITSIQDPHDIYKNTGEDPNRWLRRMKIIDMSINMNQ